MNREQMEKEAAYLQRQRRLLTVFLRLRGLHEQQMTHDDYETVFSLFEAYAVRHPRFHIVSERNALA